MTVGAEVRGGGPRQHHARTAGAAARRGCQPNHPTDDVAGHPLLSTREGLSYGCGDAVIGVNPATDTRRVAPPRSCSALARADPPERDPDPALRAVARDGADEGARRWAARWTSCSSRCRAPRRGNEAFGISVALVDEAWAHDEGAGAPTRGPNFMYFETGQGSALSSAAHHGADQVTLEARCYGFARRYQPFLVNTVVGFIGPEYLEDGPQITRAGLEDHFMGKLLGLPMGCDACFTYHAEHEPGRAGEPEGPARRRGLHLPDVAARGRRHHAQLPVARRFHDIPTVRRPARQAAHARVRRLASSSARSWTGATPGSPLRRSRGDPMSARGIVRESTLASKQLSSEAGARRRRPTS